MTDKKIDAMHRLFGRKAGYKCGECSNCVGYARAGFTGYKCRVYGITASQASDWALKYEACGKFNEDYKGRPVIEITETWRKSKAAPDEPLEGQLTWEDV